MPKRRKLNPAEPSPSSRALPKRTHPCPICNASIPSSDLSAHYKSERSLLTGQVVPAAQTTKRPAAVIALSRIVDRPRQKRSEVSNLLSRVRGNRQKRRSQQVTSNTAPRDMEDGGMEDGGERIEECPVCGVCLVGAETPVFEHVSLCLQLRLGEQRREEGEQWEVHGHERAVDMLEGGIASLPNTVIVNGESYEEGDVFIDVEGDAEEVYGKIQYTEDDLRNPRRDGNVAGTGSPVEDVETDFRCAV